MNLTFSPAEPGDVEEIFRLNRELIWRYEDLSAIDYPKVLAWVRRNIEAQLPHFRRILADGVPAGYFCLTPSDDRWELDSLFVLPDFQGRGIGNQVLKHCIAQAEGELFLYVFRENTGAIRLYRRLGFRVTREVGSTRLIMEYEKQGC